jgi:hypothetical protein
MMACMLKIFEKELAAPRTLQTSSSSVMIEIQVVTRRSRSNLPYSRLVARPSWRDLINIDHHTMPIASSSRRRTNSRTNRQPSSDGIEEDHPTQHRGEDDGVDEDGDEDEQPSRSARVKKERISKGKQPDPKVPAGDNEDDDDDRIDVENFKDQPLAREDAGKVTGIIKDWEMIRKQSQSGAGGWIEGIGVSMADLMDGEEAQKVKQFLVHRCNQTEMRIGLGGA